MALSAVAVLTSGSDSSNNQTFTTASVTLTAGRLTMIALHHSDAAPEEDATSIATTGGAITFAKLATVGFNTAASSARKLELWWVVPGSTVTDTILITLNDAGTGCGWSVFEKTGQHATPMTGTPVTGTTDSGTSVNATHGALGSTDNDLIAICGNTSDSVATVGGTDWTLVSGSGATYSTPNAGLIVGENVSGVTQQVTYSHASTIAFGLIVFEVAAAAAASAGVSLVGGKLTRSHLLGGSLFR